LPPLGPALDEALRTHERYRLARRAYFEDCFETGRQRLVTAAAAPVLRPEGVIADS
jgi:hypothetical protein